MTTPWHFRPLAAADMEMLHEWLSRPHVAEWWGTPDPIAEVAEFYAASISQTVPFWCFVAELEGQPTGFIQFYTPSAFHEDGWWLEEHDPTVRGIDQYLANASQLGQGLGSAMVRAFIGKLFEDPTVTRIQTDPSPRNGRAIRAYEKAGFRRHGEVLTPDGPALLMYCDREDFAATARRTNVSA